MSEERTYHHGNLRHALIEAALEIIEQEGYQALSLRSLAQAVKVSSGAPYRHFPDRNALLVAVASEGFRLLLESGQTFSHRDMPALEQAHAMGRAFLSFTEQRPALFMLMFDSGLLVETAEDDELGRLVRAAYAMMGDVVSALMPQASDKTLQARLIAMWSTLYGYARLRQSRLLKPYMLGQLSPQEVEHAVIMAAFECAD
jgi:AcrR family transcriptional regulator